MTTPPAQQPFQENTMPHAAAFSDRPQNLHQEPSAGSRREAASETAAAPLRDQARYTPEQIAEALGRPAPTAQQSEIISGDLSPRLVVAGAGSGKTATMVDRVVWLVVNGFVRAEEVLGVTFTAKAAGELRHRMSARLAELRDKGLYQQDQDREEPVLDPTVSTYHSYAKQLVQDYGLRIGVEKDVTLLTDAQRFQLAARVVEHWDGPLPETMPAASTLTTALLQLSGEAAEHLRTAEEIIDWCRREIDRLRAVPNMHEKKLKKEEQARNDAVKVLEQKVLVAQLARRYQRVKQTMQVMDFGDLLAYAATMARKMPVIGQEQRSLYRVVLLDEFQDTSHAQMTLFSSLFGEGHSVMAVGDPKQSIYGFRGASEGQLFDFYRHFPHPQPEERTGYLTTAWRNDVRILETANLLAADLSRPRDWVRAQRQIEVPDLQPRPDAASGQVMLGTYASDLEEARDIVQKIRESRAQHGRGETGSLPEHAVSPMPTQAVLCRTKKQFEAIRLACEEQGVPYELPGLAGLLQTPEVIDVVSTLRVLADPGRSDALMRLLAGARWRLGPRDLLALNDWARFLARRRQAAIRTGVLADLDTPEGQAPGEERRGPASDGAGEREDTAAADAAEREEWERFLGSVGQESSESASLIEALETLPPPGWTSRAGRCLSETASERLQRLASELEQLRGYLGEDLITVLYHIERTSLLDQELASTPARDPHYARENLEAFYQAAADYTATAARVSASLEVGAALRRAAPSREETGSRRDDASREQEDDPLVLPAAQEHHYSLTSSATGITAFLAWLEAASAQEGGLKLPLRPADGSAVQILTLHGSKGLEWDEVYLPGMIDGVFPTRENDHWLRSKSLGCLPWPLRGDADYLPRWDTAGLSTQALQESWDEFLEDNQERTEAEERRLAYVGVTRARSLLCLSTSHWAGVAVRPREPSLFFTDVRNVAATLNAEQLHSAESPKEDEKNPRASEVAAALWPFDPLTRPHIGRWESPESLDALSDHPDGPAFDPGPLASRRETLERAAHRVQAARERLRSAEQSSAAQSGPVQSGPVQSVPASDAENLAEESVQARAWREETDLLLALRQAEAEEPQEQPLPEHLSASVLVGLAQDSRQVLKQLRRPVPRKPSVQARAGTSFHAWVEAHYGSPAMLDLDDLLEERSDEAGEGTAEETPDSTEQGLESLQEAFRGSSWHQRQPWAVEYPLETPLGGFTLRGRVDAIFHNPHPTPGQPEWELVDWKTGRIPRGKDLENKAVQLAVYRLGFAELMGISPEQVRACFHYVAQNRTVEPSHLPGREELLELLEALQGVSGESSSNGS